MKNILAALIFFTRIPFWRIADIPKEYYKNVVVYWPAVGWLTGGISCLVLYTAAQILPFAVAVILMFIVRILITGALHDDGLADFCDGFGGGTSREKILAIMKDSHIGTYGVIGLIFYYLTTITLLQSLPLTLACTSVLAGDAWSKCCAARLIDFLPYARKKEEAKNKLIYNNMKITERIISLLLGLIPLLALSCHPVYITAAIMPVLASAMLIVLMKRRINGYTGDCCGATFLISELMFFTGMAAIHHLYE